jgi:hypothetical protein
MSTPKQEAARRFRHALKRKLDFESRLSDRVPHDEDGSEEDVAWMDGWIRAEREVTDAWADFVGEGDI